MLKLTNEQQNIINTDKQFNFVMAGAGCGKTSTLIELLKTHSTATFNYCTFTNEMLNEVKEKLYSNHPQGKSLDLDKLLYNFNSAGNRLMERIFDVDERQFRRHFIEKIEQDWNNSQPLTEAERQAIWANACEFKKRYAKICFENITLTEMEATFYKTFEYIWNKKSVCDFIDMEIWFANALVKNIIDFRNLNYFLVDELQDVDNNKFHLIKMIINKIILANQKFTKFLFVGDYNQQIYGFREQNSENYFEKLKDFVCEIDKTEIIVLPLSKCFRCDMKMVDKANALLQNLNNRGFGYSPMQSNELHAQHPQPINFVHFSNDLEQVLIQILDVIPNNNLIIARSHKELVPIQFFLIKHNVPYRLYGTNSRRFFEREKAIWFIFTNYLLHHFCEPENIPLEILKGLVGYAVNSSKLSSKEVLETGKISATAIIKHLDFEVLRGFLFNSKIGNDLNLLNHIFSDEGIFKPREVTVIQNLFAKLKTEIITTQKFLTTNELSDFLNEPTFNWVFTDNYDQVVAGFLQDFKQLLIEKDLSDYLKQTYNGTRKTLAGVSTIHSSKGLEANNVVVFSNRQYNSYVNDEETRVHYVAFTRAKRQLFLLYPKLQNPDFYFDFLKKH